MIRGFRGPRRSVQARRLPGWLQRRGVSVQVATTTLILLGSLFFALGLSVDEKWVPPSALILLALLAGYLLRFAGALAVVVAVTLEVVFLNVADLVNPYKAGDYLFQAVAFAAVLWFAHRNDRIGLAGTVGNVMLVDLRDRLQAHARIPALPHGWRVDHALRSAYADAFSGDFFVAAVAESGSMLEIVLVDVSGKGQDAGVRSLLLSGAFGGLLGAMPRDQFLSAANDYLLRQDWDEGFATAVHVAVQLSSGDFWVASAGHPPAVHRHAGSGVFEVLDTIGGPALGIVADPVFRTHTGRLQPGDALLLYTDGMVESPGADLEIGIDRLLGVAEQVVATGQGGAEAVLKGVGAGAEDDRALLLVHRE